MLRIASVLSRFLAVVLIILAAGWLSISQWFTGSSDILAWRIDIAVIILAIGSLTLGLLVPRLWPLAALNVWSYLLFGLVVRPLAVFPDRLMQSVELIPAAFLLVPAISLAAAWTGARIRSRGLSRIIRDLGIVQ